MIVFLHFLQSTKFTEGRDYNFLPQMQIFRLVYFFLPALGESLIEIEKQKRRCLAFYSNVTFQTCDVSLLILCNRVFSVFPLKSYFISLSQDGS